mmetsp:Transcript_835/g.3243  ORF Transcript_835/g.3243 Transcript_835/m.3243 type:complete len:644 (-) Transcript_835:29-1960(-)
MLRGKLLEQAGGLHTAGTLHDGVGALEEVHADDLSLHQHRGDEVRGPHSHAGNGFRGKVHGAGPAARALLAFVSSPLDRTLLGGGLARGRSAALGGQDGIEGASPHEELRYARCGGGKVPVEGRDDAGEALEIGTGFGRMLALRGAGRRCTSCGAWWRRTRSVRCRGGREHAEQLQQPSRVLDVLQVPQVSHKLEKAVHVHPLARTRVGRRVVAGPVAVSHAQSLPEAQEGAALDIRGEEVIEHRACVAERRRDHVPVLALEPPHAESLLDVVLGSCGGASRSGHDLQNSLHSVEEEVTPQSRRQRVRNVLLCRGARAVVLEICRLAGQHSALHAAVPHLPQRVVKPSELALPEGVPRFGVRQLGQQRRRHLRVVRLACSIAVGLLVAVAVLVVAVLVVLVVVLLLVAAALFPALLGTLLLLLGGLCRLALAEELVCLSCLVVGLPHRHRPPGRGCGRLEQLHRKPGREVAPRVGCKAREDAAAGRDVAKSHHGLAEEDPLLRGQLLEPVLAVEEGSHETAELGAAFALSVVGPVAAELGAEHAGNGHVHLRLRVGRGQLGLERVGLASLAGGPRRAARQVPGPPEQGAKPSRAGGRGSLALLRCVSCHRRASPVALGGGRAARAGSLPALRSSSLARRASLR